MLKIFRSNNPLTIVPLLLYLLLLKLALYIFPFELNAVFNTPLGLLTKNLINSWSGWNYYWNISAAMLLILFQALYLNFIVNKNKVLEHQSYLVAMSYILLSSLFNGFNEVSQPLLSATFIIPAIDRIFSIYKKEYADMEIFDAALYISIAALFFFPAIIFLIWTFIALAIQKPFSIREWLIIIIGALVPFFLAFTYFFWFDQLDFFVFEFLQIRIEPYALNLTFDGYFISKAGILITLSALFFFNMMQFTTVGNIQLRKYNTILLLLLIFSLLSLLFQPVIEIYHFYMIIIPLSVVFAYNFMQQGRENLIEIPHLLLIIAVLITQYFNFALLKNLF